jgi:LmbE family N-acetylglucosaminyl deacetylase
MSRSPWPIDSHRDHRAASLLAYDAWERGGRRFELYYSEVDLGGETKNFQPTHYVDITAVIERKRLACLAHDSQNHGGFYARYTGRCSASAAWSRDARPQRLLCAPARIRRATASRLDRNSQGS